MDPDTIVKIKASNWGASAAYPRALICLKMVDDTLHVGLCDGTDSIKLICYETKNIPKFIIGETIIVRNFTIGKSTLFLRNGRVSSPRGSKEPHLYFCGTTFRYWKFEGRNNGHS